MFIDLATSGMGHPIFDLVGMNDKVREMIETTGFDSIFC